MAGAVRNVRMRRGWKIKEELYNNTKTGIFLCVFSQICLNEMFNVCKCADFPQIYFCCPFVCFRYTVFVLVSD